MTTSVAFDVIKPTIVNKQFVLRDGQYSLVYEVQDAAIRGTRAPGGRHSAHNRRKMTTIQRLVHTRPNVQPSYSRPSYAWPSYPQPSYPRAIPVSHPNRGNVMNILNMRC